MASKYDRIASELRIRIEQEYRPGDRLPPETSLMADYDVSLATLRRAVDVLETSGLVERQHGIGTFVRRPRARVRRTTDRYQWEKERVLLPEAERRATGATEQDTGLTVHDLVFKAEYSAIAADNDLAAAFGIEPGVTLLRRIYRTRAAGDAPFYLSYSYLVHSIAASNPELLKAENEPWPGGTQHQLSTVGIEVDRIEDKISARPPTPDEAEALSIDPGVSLLALRKTMVGTSGDVVEVADVLMPGDRTEMVYSTQLAPWPKPAARRGGKR